MNEWINLLIVKSLYKFSPLTLLFNIWLTEKWTEWPWPIKYGKVKGGQTTISKWEYKPKIFWGAPTYLFSQQQNSLQFYYTT